MVLCSRVLTLCYHILTVVPRWRELSLWCPWSTVVRTTLLLTFNWWIRPGGDSHGAMVTGGGGRAVTALSSPLTAGQRKRPSQGSSLGGFHHLLPVSPHPALSLSLYQWTTQGQAMQRSGK